MAAGITLKMKFDTMSGSRTWTFKNAKANATTASVKSLASTMIANASVFQYQPVRLADARIVETTESVYDLS